MQSLMKITIFFQKSVQNFNVVTTCEVSTWYTIIFWFFTRFKYLQIMRKLHFILKFLVFSHCSC